jgi:hypothetical protein
MKRHSLGSVPHLRALPYTSIKMVYYINDQTQFGFFLPFKIFGTK